MLLRRQRPRGRVRSLSVDFQPETASPDITNVGDKFPKAKDKPWLLRRLGNAVTLRRLRIQYRQKHHNSLSQEPTTDGKEDTATSKATTFVEGESPPEAPYASSAFSAATSLLSCYSSEHGGRQIPELTRLTYNGIKLEYNKSFECPFCYTIQKVADQWEWKKHVFWDLQPYVCTFEECVQSSDLFDSRASWFDHQMKMHYCFWSCLFCSSNLHSEEDLQRHLNDSHPGKVTRNQFPMISEACKRLRTEFDEFSCPFCSSWMSNDPQSNNIKAFSRHEARHLQQISLEALPIYIEGLEVEFVPESLRNTPEEEELESEEIAGIQESTPEEQGQETEDPQVKGVTSKDRTDGKQSKAANRIIGRINRGPVKKYVFLWQCVSLSRQLPGFADCLAVPMRSRRDTRRA
ncbi:hypothetical protein CCHR01_08232 [Colletotrichum chrysophilum]|uniref:C2H2-type domain-containing protein n=1 Tax=Colletotrichum chrysophilum TaxID=1836956 RepID=A0AAD9EHX4_9PEZI|nr:hypothetical protein CCHR01_08232 [Colletotrichum chrysophilum]